MRVTGITYRQIQYWDSRVVNIDRKSGKNNTARYRSFKISDVIIFALVAALKANDVSLQKIRKHFLPQIYDVLSIGLTPNDKVGLVGETIVVWDGSFYPANVITKLIETGSLLNDLDLPIACVSGSTPTTEEQHTYI